MTRSRILLVAALAVTLGWISLAVETFLSLGLADTERIATGVQSYAEQQTSIPRNPKEAVGTSESAKIAESVRSELDAGLGSNAAVIGLGAIFALMALALPKYRGLAVLGSCLVYWALWYRHGFPSDVSLIDAYHLKWLTAKAFNTVAVFFFKDIILPLIFGASVVASAAVLVSLKGPERFGRAK